jgi:hypothetical protein
MGARLLYALLKMHAWQKDSAYPGQERLGELMGVKVRMVQIYLKELTDAGLIDRKQRGGTKSNVYYIQPLNAIYCAGDTQSITGHKAQDIAGHDTQSITPEEYSGKNTQKKKTQVSSGATPQARAPRAAKRDMGRDIPPPDPAFDCKALWAAIEAHTGRKLLWSYAIETQAVKRIVRAYPAVTVAELIAFLAYLETVFPWSRDPTKQVTFSEGAKHFAGWYTGTQPTTLVEKGSTANGRAYESPGERREREWMESIASIYGTGAPAGDHRGATEHEPPAVPARSPAPRLISLDGRRVG